MKNGDLDRLLVPTDSSGRKCGIDNGVYDKPYLLFFNLEKCVDPRVPLFGCKTTQVCVKECPKESFVYNHCSPQTLDQIRRKLICKDEIDRWTIHSCEQLDIHMKNEECASWYLESNSCKCRICFSYNFLLFILLHFMLCLFCCFCFRSCDNFFFRVCYFLFICWQFKE